MAEVTFFMLEAPNELHPAHWTTACDLAAQCYRTRRRCVVLCQDKASAEAFDEFLWQRPLDAFVPHNLAGEGPKGGAPVEIIWSLDGLVNRPNLINLANDIPTDLRPFRQIYDFVPSEEADKQQARLRYKQYRAAGSMLSTQPANSIYEKHDG